MRYLSLFSGIGGFEYGIHRVFPHAECVGFSEIDKNAIKVYQHHFPTHVNLGNVESITEFPAADIVFGGSPCQDLSGMNLNRKGLTGDKSRLFFMFVKVLQSVKPRYFILENTFSMTQADRDVITHTLGVEPVLIDSAWFGAQQRKRLFWANFPIDTSNQYPSPLALSDVLCPLADVQHLKHSSRALSWLIKPYCGSHRLARSGQSSERQKARTVLATFAKGVPNNVLIDHRQSPVLIRSFSVPEIERLQGFPVGWTNPAPYTRRFKVLGNAVNGEVAVFVFKMLQSEENSQVPQISVAFH